jgi:hypothetical protein
MKRKTIVLSIFAIGFIAITYNSCVFNDKTRKFSNTVTPQRLPSVVPGFSFPEDSTNIYAWLNAQDTTSITKHAWGIWAGLTSNSNQIYDATDTLLIYETWFGISDIATQCADLDTLGGCSRTKSTREKLHYPHQLSHVFGTSATPVTNENPGFYVSVSYDPNAACFATKNLLLNQSTLNKRLVSGGIGKIKPFPNSSITLKPTYYIGKVTDNFIRIPAWPGEPGSQAQVYGQSQWNSYVYADVNNGQTPGKIAVPADSSQVPPPETAIVNLNEFIYYPLDSAAAAYVNTQQQGQAGTVAAGDLAILVCMHVGTKEISNWTWQTFFWTTNPAAPLFPSSPWQAALRPAQLHGAASHYAVATAYAMVWPNQPITKGTNTNVKPIFAYNPYLEPGLGAPFGNVNKLNSKFQYGMQTNCMGCHAFATCNTSPGSSLNYSADQYVDMADTIFVDWVQLDFAWSIQQNVNKNN